MTSRTFLVSVTRDLLGPDHPLGPLDIGLDALDGTPFIRWECLEEDSRELAPDQVESSDAVLVGGARVTSASLDGVERLALVARFGVGYDTVDVEACTRSDVLLTITPDGVRRSVASGAIAFLLALGHRLLTKDRLTREGRWSERLHYMGTGLTGRTLGVVGLGNIGREVFALAHPFSMRHIGHDPYADRQEVERLSIRVVDLEELLREADFVCICCALTPETHHLIDAKRLALMKPEAYLINVARGPIVDQEALTDALKERRIRGAALDVFEEEPVDPDHPLLKLENVIVTPHAVSWTDQCFREIGFSACRSILDVAAGRAPADLVNREVLERPGMQEKLRRLAERSEEI